MLFHEKLALIKEITSASGTAIAKEAGLASSCVSRYLSSKNAPFRFGDTVTRVAHAAAALASGAKERGALREAASAREEERTADAVERWLNEADSGLREKKSADAAKSPGRVGIAAKLDALMNAFRTTNAELARYANADGSSISRYRSGKRSVRRDDPILRSFCRYFAFLCQSRGVPSALADEIGASAAAGEEAEALAARLFDWMCEDCGGRRGLARSLLKSMESARGAADEAEPPPSGGARETNVRLYSGAGGVLAAAGDFARAAGEDGEPRGIYVYTSYLSWFAREPRFAGSCAALLRGMAERGHKVKSVHNIGFDAEEIFDMIETWLPLFFTGNVEARYLTRPNRSLFSEYMSAAENCSLRFSTLRGSSIRPRALFSRSREEAAFVIEHVEGLAEYSKPLVKFYGADEAEKLRREIEDFREADGDVIKLTRGPTFESMPENLAGRLFARIAPSREAFAALERRYEKRRRGFLESLAHVNVTEVFPALSRAEIASGAASVALPWGTGFTAAYTPDEYEIHIAALERLAAERANYRAVRRASLPFSKIDVTAKEGTAVYVLKNDDAPSAISFLNSQVRCVLERYVKRFIKNGKG